MEPSVHDRPGTARVLLSSAHWAFLALSSAVLFLGALLLWALTRPFDANGRVLHLYSCFWAQLYFYVNPRWHLRVEGRERLPWRGAAVLVSNHESLGDILVHFGLYRPFKWVSKARTSSCHSLAGTCASTAMYRSSAETAPASSG
ncbi:hypothetical protein [Corallococcus sp. AB045]|uniref:hypothetical protein n=1 Tax=Corallococcus sp. AB045 TaxID=2316719 RepID=UPI001F175913|nr:hypothetical protein [Corallococcus sp. AB045]